MAFKEQIPPLKQWQLPLERGEKLMNTVLTKGTICPIVKSVSKWFGVNMTKQVLVGFFKKAISVVGGAIGVGITYLLFKPCCYKLKESLHDTLLSNPDYYPKKEETGIVDTIEIQEM